MTESRSGKLCNDPSIAVSARFNGFPSFRHNYWGVQLTCEDYIFIGESNDESWSLKSRGGRRYQIFETATATSLLRYRYLVYFLRNKKSFSLSFSEYKNSQKHYLNYTWSSLTGEPHLTTPYKAAVLVRWPEGICRRLRSRDDPALRCDTMTWENYLYIGSSVTDK